MKVNLKGMSRKELEKLKANIDKALEKISVSEMKAARSAAEKAAKSYGFSLDDIMEAPAPTKIRKPRKAAANVGVARYKNPEDASQTWTGKGRRPKWVIAAQEAGKSLDDLAI